MRYRLEIVLQKPVKKVMETFDSTENLKHWQKGFVSFSPISGELGEEGSKAKMIYQMGNREIEMTETIIKKNLPHEFHGTFETTGVYNTQENYFEILDENATKWITVSDFKFTNFKMKLIGFLMPSSFKKTSYQYMIDFKNYIEKGISVAEK
ncbi:hypothetical protein SAMN05216480_102133 [Pustulibacterium marinum]|uniref:Polyketide cyclase / dehydrase and lipid transport n=1 Tax=Pustulibacterium marinum TaxID=1224947 RepID=A0A1I7FQR6_9FLAO|nr:SRPBCC family protein [Pustulibacterium marinum]SFU38554.1 hypothetical protein SAMN05216480_102133 [Pustulibacterium marinum]